MGKTLPPNVSVDLLHNFDHFSVVCCVKFSSDSRYLATGCNRVAQIFDVHTGAKVGLVDTLIIYLFSEIFKQKNKKTKQRIQ